MTDFNVMTDKDWWGTLEVAGKIDDLLLVDSFDDCFLWVIRGELLLDAGVLAADEGMFFSGPEKISGQIRDKSGTRVGY